MMRVPKIVVSLFTLLLMMTGLAAAGKTPTPDWQTSLQQILPLLGHRNWIMIVDSAYPLQSSAGVETLETNSDQLEVLRTVLSAIDNSIHVRPIVYMDAELPFVSERDAPGVTAYREGIKTALSGHKITSVSHGQIISRVDEVGKTFHIVVLKTTMALPYTSIFLELRAKYWNDDAEAQMRKAMASGAAK
jgi:L-fucose mutarotase/ribose pyranase (RbsD/FucU family)